MCFVYRPAGISHYINPCKFVGETFGQRMIVRASLERLTPVQMTALTAALALVIFGGLVGSTLLDTLLTPLMFWLFGEKPLQQLLQDHNNQVF